MLKSVNKNSLLYKNVNNVWLVYEYLGNNSFSEDELFELWDFLQQNNLMMEFHILNYKGTKKYYVSFFLGEVWYSNNYSNFKNDDFHLRYHTILNLKTVIETRLWLFSRWRLKPTEMKLYNVEKKQEWKSHREILLKQLWYNREKVRNYLIGENFWLFLENLLYWIDGEEYKRYIYNKMYLKQMNFEFYNTDQEIFDSTLNFLTGSKFFIFPFYLKGKNTRVGNLSYQELDLNSIVSGFLDNNVMNWNKDTSKDLVGYLYKVSIKPTQSVSVDPNKNRVTYNGISSEFDLKSVWDNKYMFFEFQHSMYFYTKRPDIQALMTSFTDTFQSIIDLDSVPFPRDFNPQYLSHNKFWAAYHIWHLQNIFNIATWMKEYLPPMKDGMLLWKEHFSHNDFKVNLFDLAKKDADWNLETSCHSCIIWNTGAWKTYFTYHKIWKKNKKDQLIVFDNMDNFSKEYNKMPDGPEKDSINLFEYWEDFPNVIWNITNVNLGHKQEILLNLILGAKNEMTDADITALRAVINTHLKQLVWNTFSLDRFVEWVRNFNPDYLTDLQKKLILAKLDWMNETIKRILNNTRSFDNEIYKKQRIIISYSKLTDGADEENKFFMLAILLRLIRSYLAQKNAIPNDKVNYRYTMILYDEAHKVLNKNPRLDNEVLEMLREIRNRKAQMTLITQFYSDLAKVVWTIKFFVLLDPESYEAFREDHASKDPNIESQFDRTFRNFTHSILWIIEKYKKDADKIDRWLMESKDRMRFCVVANKIHEADSMYILDTRE